MSSLKTYVSSLPGLTDKELGTEARSAAALLSSARKSGTKMAVVNLEKMQKAIASEKVSRKEALSTPLPPSRRMDRPIRLAYKKTEPYDAILYNYEDGTWWFEIRDPGYGGELVYDDHDGRSRAGVEREALRVIKKGPETRPESNPRRRISAADFEVIDEQNLRFLRGPTYEALFRKFIVGYAGPKEVFRHYPEGHSGRVNSEPYFDYAKYPDVGGYDFIINDLPMGKRSWKQASSGGYWQAEVEAWLTRDGDEQETIVKGKTVKDAHSKAVKMAGSKSNPHAKPKKVATLAAFKKLPVGTLITAQGYTGNIVLGPRGLVGLYAAPTRMYEINKGSELGPLSSGARYFFTKDLEEFFSKGTWATPGNPKKAAKKKAGKKNPKEMSAAGRGAIGAGVGALALGPIGAIGLGYAATKYKPVEAEGNPVVQNRRKNPGDKFKVHVTGVYYSAETGGMKMRETVMVDAQTKDEARKKAASKMSDRAIEMGYEFDGKHRGFKAEKMGPQKNPSGPSAGSKFTLVGDFSETNEEIYVYQSKANKDYEVVIYSLDVSMEGGRPMWLPPGKKIPKWYGNVNFEGVDMGGTLDGKDPASILRKADTAIGKDAKSRKKYRAPVSMEFPRGRNPARPNPKKKPKETLVAKSRRLWDVYVAKPTRKNLKPVLRHLGAMEKSAEKTAKAEFRQAKKSVYAEAKRLRMKV